MEWVLAAFVLGQFIIGLVYVSLRYAKGIPHVPKQLMDDGHIAALEEKAQSLRERGFFREADQYQAAADGQRARMVKNLYDTIDGGAVKSLGKITKVEKNTRFLSRDPFLNIDVESIASYGDLGYFRLSFRAPADAEELLKSALGKAVELTVKRVEKPDEQT